MLVSHERAFHSPGAVREKSFSCINMKHAVMAMEQKKGFLLRGQEDLAVVQGRDWFCMESMCSGTDT